MVREPFSLSRIITVGSPICAHIGGLSDLSFLCTVNSRTAQTLLLMMVVALCDLF